MTATTRNPHNPNFLQPNKFQLSFSRLPNMQYFCQTVSVPGISTGEVAISNPLVELYSPGDKAIYDTLNITFMVDEKIDTWTEIHDWIRAMTYPTDLKEYSDLRRLNKNVSAKQNFPQFSDATLVLLSSANNPVYRIKYHELFPISLSGFIMSSTDTPDSIITADATFRYSYFDVEKV